jgi:hypothetical protein
MDWKVGQKVVCDRPEQLLQGCTIQTMDVDSVVISCPTVNLVICGKQRNLEQLGWRVDTPNP